MLPVVRGERTTALRVLMYTVVLVAVSLVPVLTGTFGGPYIAAALALGAIFLALAFRLWRHTTPANAALTFHFSLLYLALLFVAVAVDATVG
jgi:protoheme IX farnesyltransferase